MRLSFLLSRKMKAIISIILFCQNTGIDAFCRGFDSFARGRIAQRRVLLYREQTGMNTRFSIPLSTPANGFPLMGFFGGLFGAEDSETDKRDKVLATFDIKLSDGADMNVKYDSLSDFITNKWLMLFANGSIQLTTPVSISKSDIAGDVSTCRLIFEKVDTGYKNKKEEGGGLEKDDGESATSEEKITKQGGVEISILPPSDTDLRLEIRVTRCEIEDDTVIKEMSEEKILKELRKAIDIWRNERLQ